MKNHFTPILALLLSCSFSIFAGDGAHRPMTFMDVVGMRAAGSPAVSPDGKWMLYTLTSRDWKAGKSFTDVYLVSLARGVESTRQMTFTKDKNETSPQWSRDGRFFAFLSDRDGPEGKAVNQIYLMHPD